MSAKHDLRGDVTVGSLDVDAGSGIARIDLTTTASFGRPFYLYTNGLDAIINAQDSLKLRADGGDAEIHLNPSGQDYISFTTASTERMRINQPGNVLIGTTTDSGEKLQVAGNTKIEGELTLKSSSSSNKLIFDSTSWSQVDEKFEIGVDTTNGSGEDYMYLGLQGAPMMYFKGSTANPNNNPANIGINTVVPIASSELDIRGKSDTGIGILHIGAVDESSQKAGGITFAHQNYEKTAIYHQHKTGAGGYSLGDLVIAVNNDSNGTKVSTADEVIRFSRSKRVGIKTGETIDARLHVIGEGDTTSTTALLVENSNQSPSLVVNDAGNVLIGTTTDAGYKLDVNGSGRVKGSGTTSSTTALLVENSNSSASLEVLDNGDVEILNGRLVLQNGDNSVYIGLNTGANDDKTNNSNIGIGPNALAGVTSGTANVAIGRNALSNLTTGNYNVAIGNYALGSNTTEQGITAIGYSSQINSTSGRRNTSLGYRALSLNQTGDNNVVVGYNAQYNNSVNGVALVGYLAGENNSGGRVVGVGYQALQNNSGADNTALGYLSGYSTVYQTGSNNTFLGYQSTYSSSASNISNSTAVGANVSLTDSNTVILGNNANVGIGTTSPSYKLDVDGTARAVKSKIDFTPTSDTIALDIRGTGTPNDFFTVSNATGGANDVFLPIFFYKAASYGYNGGTNRYPSGVYGGGFIAAVDDTSYPSSTGAGAAMHFNSRTYANSGPLSNRYLFSWGSWLTTYMAMTAGGNLLIGTTTDSGEKLQVNGNADISGDVYAAGDVGVGNDAPAYRLDVSGDINSDGDFYQGGTQGFTGTVTIQQPSPQPPITIEINGGIITNVT